MVRSDCICYKNGGCIGLRHTYCEIEDDCRFYKNYQDYDAECIRLYGRDWRKESKLRRCEHPEELLKLNDMGYSYSEICKMTGFSYSTVSKYINQLRSENNG